MNSTNRTARRFPINKFTTILDLLIAGRRHTTYSLGLALSGSRTPDISACIRDWRVGAYSPRGGSRNAQVKRIESYFRRPQGFLGDLIDHEYSQRFEAKNKVNARLEWVVEWHLPDDFDERKPAEQQEILDWLSANVLDGTTEFGKYLGKRTTSSFGIVFPKLTKIVGIRKHPGPQARKAVVPNNYGTFGTIPAPPRLSKEMRELVQFKTDLLPRIGFKRYSRWAPVTAQTVLKKFGYLFGALAAAPRSRDAGLGVPLSKLTLALIVFPTVLDWYLEWSEKRKGFFTATDLSFLYQVRLHLRNPSGWVKQNPALAEHLEPIEGLITSEEIDNARNDWALACERTYFFVGERALELARVRRQHRDPFVAILPVLSSEEPLREYRKIADEIIRLLPDERSEPEESAIAVRSYLMMRLAIHSGFRQANLRTLLFCKKGEKQRSQLRLETLRCGELRWSGTKAKWEIFIPALAFKNGKSPFFSGRPLLIELPDLAGLYEMIDRYIVRHRQVLLDRSADPGAFFVKSMRHAGSDPVFDRQEFYVAWKAMIRRYGIYNPYTKRGAIEGLLPHGPHCVRDVLATHVLKKTGSYELAGFTIQDTVQVVMRHYARFQPHEKAARAAEVINKVWE